MFNLNNLLEKYKQLSALFTIILHYFELDGHKESICFPNHFYIGLSNIFDLPTNLRKSHKLFLILLKIKAHTGLNKNHELNANRLHTNFNRKKRKKVLGSPEKEVNSRSASVIIDN